MPFDDDILVNIRGAADDLRRATRQAVRDLKDVGDEARRQTAQGTVLRAENRRVASSFDEIGDQARQAAYSMGLYSREATKVQIRSNGVSQGLRDVGVNLRAVAWGTAIANIGPLSAGLLDLAAAGTAAGTALAPLAGVAAALPSVLGAAGQASFVTSLAFNQMEEAIKGNKDALAALDPLQRQLVDRIRNELAPEIQKLQGIAQEGLLPGVSEAFTDVMTLAPEVERVLGRTSKVMGELAKQGGDWIAKPGVQRDLQRFGLNNALLLGKLGRGAIDVADGFRHITMAAQPLVDHLGDLAEEGAKTFDVWAKGARSSGDLADFFDLTSTRVDQSLSILGDFAGVLGSLFSGSQPLANSMMSGLVRDMDHLHSLVSSPEGQQSLKQFFADAREPLGAVANLAGDLVVAIGKLGLNSQGELTQLANALDEDVLPLLEHLAALLTTDLLPHLIDLVGDLTDLADAVLPGLKPVVDLVGELADGLGEVVQFTTSITEDLPGIAKIAPSLALGAGTLAGWRLVKDVLGGTRGRGGKLGGVLDIAFGKGSLGTAANPMKVWVVNSLGGLDAPTTDRPGTLSKFKSLAKTAGESAGLRFALSAGAESALPIALILSLALTNNNDNKTTGPEAAKARAKVGPGDLKSPAGLPPDRTATSMRLSDSNRAIDLTSANRLYGYPDGGAATSGLQAIADKAKNTRQAIKDTTDRIKDLREEMRRLRQDDPHDGRLLEFGREIGNLEDFKQRLQDARFDKVTTPQFEAIKDSAGKNLRTIERTIDRSTTVIRQQLGSKSQQGKDALAENFRLAAQAVAKSMKDGEVSTSRGLAKIEEYMRKYLAQYGIKGKEATRYLNGQDTKTGKDISSERPGGYAQGGLVPGLNQLGRPGAAGRDEIPMLLNGRKVMAAEGETVAVLNRHQRAKLDRLAGRGGLAGFIKGNSRPNYMASGGIVEAAGGLQLPAHPETSHETAGLPGYPAKDIFGAPGTPVLSPVDGVITKLSGQAGGPGGGGAFGYSIYIDGANGESYFLTHFGSRSVQVGQRVHRGQMIGTIADYPDRADHIHEGVHGGTTGIMGNTTTGGGAPSAIVVPKIPRVGFQKGLGTLSAIGQAGLDRVRGAAQAKLEALIGGGGPGGGGDGEALRRRFGLPAVFDDIRYAESRNDPNAHNPSGASGWYQIMMPLHAALVQQVAARLGRPANVYDKVVNTAVAAELYHQAGLSPWTASRGLWAKAGSYASQGWINAALGLGDITSLGDPKAPEKSKTPKKSRDAEKRRPKTSGPGRPDLSKVRPGRGRRGKSRQKPVPQWIKDMLIADGQSGVLGFLPDFDATFEGPINSAESAINNLSSLFDLSQEQPTVTLYDSDQYPDLSNWLAAHPEDLAGAKTPAEFMERYGNGLEVVNQDGLTVQGQFVRGIAQRVDELHKLLTMHTGAEDGTGTSQLLGSRLAFLDAMSNSGPQALASADGVVGSKLAQLGKARAMRRDDLRDEREHLQDLRAKGTPYTKRVALLNAQIDKLRQYKEDIAKAAIGHRLSDEGQQNRQWATDKISDLTNEIQALQAEYGNDPDARLLPDMPVKPSGKRATKRNLAAYQAALAKWRRKQALYLRALTKSNQQIDLDQRTLGVIRDATGQWTDRHQSIVDKGQEFGSRAASLRDDEIPAQRLTITTLQGEIADLLNTRVAPRPIDTTGSTGQNGELADLLRQQNDELRRNFAISQAQYPALQGIAGLVGQRVLGSFLHGTEYVPARGLYELHEGERVTPAPDGPFFNQAQAAQQGGGPMEVQITLAGDVAGLVRVVDARINQKAARVIDQQLGRQGRLIAAAPGGRR